MIVDTISERGLHDFVLRLASDVGVKPPDVIVVVADANAYVREFGPFMGLLRGSRTLAIGAPLLDALDVRQLEAVLAHELGHLASGDTRFGPLSWRTNQALARLVETTGVLIGPIFMWYWKFQRKLTAGARHEQDLIADRAAVRIAGRPGGG